MGVALWARLWIRLFSKGGGRAEKGGEQPPYVLVGPGAYKGPGFPSRGGLFLGRLKRGKRSGRDWRFALGLLEGLSVLGKKKTSICLVFQGKKSPQGKKKGRPIGRFSSSGRRSRSLGRETRARHRKRKKGGGAPRFVSGGGGGNLPHEGEGGGRRFPLALDGKDTPPGVVRRDKSERCTYAPSGRGETTCGG